MKKHVFFFLGALYLLCSSNVDVYGQDCNRASDAVLFGNEFFKAILLNGGDAFWDLADGGYFVPYEEDTEELPSTVFASAIWLGGVDPGGNIRVAAQTYRQSGNDYWPGPLDSDGNTTNATCSDYNQIWTVEIGDLTTYLADLADNGRIDKPIPLSILKWPGSGNPFSVTANGFELSDQDLAPFYDANNDGLYDPSQGEYPVYEHNNPDAIPRSLAWMVFNDKGNEHTVSGGPSMNVEVQATYWTLTSENVPALNTTLFRKDKVINRGTETLDPFHFGTFMDGDIGCFNDDYTGSAPDLNTFYFYNGRANDPNCGVPGYGDNPPVFAYTFLNQPLSTYQLFIDGFSFPFGGPSDDQEYFNLLTGRFQGGPPIEYGGNGYNQGTFTHPWFYSSNPNDTSANAWSEVALMNIPSDRRGVGASGPYILNPGQALEFDQMFSFWQDADLNNLETVDLMYAGVPVLQQLYDTDFEDNQPIPLCSSDCVWPGDANSDGIVDHLDFLRFYNSAGVADEPRLPASREWLPYNNPNWPVDLIQLDGISFAFADGDGDGAIDPTLDGEVILENYGRISPNFTGLSGQDIRGDQLTVRKIGPSEPLEAMELDAPNVLEVVLRLPSEFQGEIAGISFELQIDDPDFLPLNFAPAEGQLTPEFDVDVLLKPDPRTFQLAKTSTTGQTMSANQEVMIARFVLQFSTPPEDCTVNLEFRNIQIILSDGTFCSITNEDNSWPVTGCSPVRTEDPIEANLDFELVPNPTQDEVLVDALDQVVESVEVYNAIGQLVAVPTNCTVQPRLDVRHLPDGVYFVRVSLPNGELTKRLVVQR
ncbi:MAG: T9SS type A sorting domain-containing protein [Bacteroidota bacterium]